MIEAWGFAHKTTAFTWAKQNESGEGWHMGQGYWTRANPEDCWLATRGSPKRLYADVRQLIVAPVMEHSRKPDEIHDASSAWWAVLISNSMRAASAKNWMDMGQRVGVQVAPAPATAIRSGSRADRCYWSSSSA